MHDPRFPILGTSIPDMIGRSAGLDRVWGLLTKASPSHLSVVGPRYSGKTVSLNALARRARLFGSPYVATVLWDLRHQTPRSDGDFLKGLSRHVGDQLRAVDQQRFHDYVDYIESGEYGDLKEAAELLEAEDIAILVIL